MIPGIGMKSNRRRRDWSQANEKFALELGTCRGCGTTVGVERAHVTGREHDYSPPVRNEEEWRPGDVHPDRIVPLCGPPTDPSSCHGKDHFGRLEWLPLLTLPEQVQAVADAGGIQAALLRLSPSANPKRVRSAA